MTANDHRSIWERLDDNTCAHRFDERTRWRVGTFAQSLPPSQHEVRGEILAEEAEAWLRAEVGRLERQRAAQDAGYEQGWPGE